VFGKHKTSVCIVSKLLIQL